MGGNSPGGGGEQGRGTGLATCRRKSITNPPKSYLIDMDGVLVSGRTLIARALYRHQPRPGWTRRGRTGARLRRDGSPFFVGKPNPLMMRTALNYLDVHSEDTVMVGDRMETDIIAGVESGMETILVLTGVTSGEDVARYPYQPTRIAASVTEIEPQKTNRGQFAEKQLPRMTRSSGADISGSKPNEKTRYLGGYPVIRRISS